ncbi:GTP-binding protein RHO2 [Dissostichus eleginoides]|uniref:GTP-binding protein RHO2 n=1 Tax=Dissostichus eleginoides TaxID=100907 RepID=A0AAD9F927_DISEL|nr:GTP-binding protein RHO2 [Dissostichus eleginoides]
MPDGRLPKGILYGELSAGSRGRGRPLLRFKDVVKRDMKALDIATDNWERLAEDRTKWRQQQLREGGDRLDKYWTRGLALKRGHTVSR